MSKKIRIIRNHRLRTVGETIAFSEQVFDRIRGKVTRLNGAFVSKRGEHGDVMSEIRNAVREMPEHFTEKSRIELGHVGYDM